MSGHEAFFSALFLGALILLAVALVTANWVAVAWACFSLLGSGSTVAMDRNERRADR